MKQRTAEIIMICKGSHELGKGDYKELIKKYMADRCGYPEEEYTEEMINREIRNTAYDFIDCLTESSPGDFLREAEEILYQNNECAKISSLINAIDYETAICKTFALAYVKNFLGYVNGFTEENTKKVTLIHNKK